MGLKFCSVMFNGQRVENEELVLALRDIIIDMESEYFKSESTTPDKIPSFLGSKLIELTPEHPDYHFRMIFPRTLGEEDFLIHERRVAIALSQRFKDIPFLVAGYHSGSDSGSVAVFINGEPFESVNGKEGDNYRSSTGVFNKYFGIKKVFKTFDDYLIQSFCCSPYELSSYAYLKYQYERFKDSTNKYEQHYVKQFNEVQELLKISNINETEWKPEYPIDFLKRYALNKRAVDEQTHQPVLYLLTDGCAWSEDGAFFRDVPEILTPNEFFTLRDWQREQYEEYKDRKYGKRPSSYSLSEKELKTLSYDEQKRRAYELYEIAKKREDETFGSCTRGILIQLPAKKGEYIKFKGDYLRAVSGWFREDWRAKTYRENFKCVKNLPDKNAILTVFIEPEEWNSIEHVEEKDVPFNLRIEDKHLS